MSANGRLEGENRRAQRPGKPSASVTSPEPSPVAAKPPARQRGRGRRASLARFREGIIDRGLRGLPLDEQLGGFCRQVVETGVPLRRASLSIGTLHPRYGAHSFIWRYASGEVEHTPRERSMQQLEVYQRSPIYQMRRTGRLLMRRRLDTGDAAAREFLLFDDLRAEGMTDYIARIVPFETAHEAAGAKLGAHRIEPVRRSSLEGIFLSACTDAPGGFDARELRLLRDAAVYLAVAFKARATFDVANDLLSIYLGADAGRRVLTGEIDRGSMRVIPAVIWLCDLRGFSRLARIVPREQLIDVLDAYLEELARPVQRCGGQILKFLGDGFLATFDVASVDQGAICANDALEAADELIDAFPRFNASRRAAGLPVMDFGVAIHQGEVLYGNIGTPDRLDFTVIGPAVNEAARIESLCRPLGHRILVSEAFHRVAGACRSRLVSVGAHRLRGLPEPQQLYTLASSTLAEHPAEERPR
jgi:adenylate cyclase